MTADGDSAPVATEPLTAESALANAARLLHNAEMVTDHSLMARLESLADSWIAIARTINERG
ncbi:hypothetical protein ACFXKC_40790 [Streptomyces sp. NPDC059340]|uniref:hypothetical protein n=1 Tax=Streptomyces sp. NPDC059340 TaxID=3346806 RepID=UPI00369BC3FB